MRGRHAAQFQMESNPVDARLMLTFDTFRPWKKLVVDKVSINVGDSFFWLPAEPNCPRSFAPHTHKFACCLFASLTDASKTPSITRAVLPLPIILPFLRWILLDAMPWTIIHL